MILQARVLVVLLILVMSMRTKAVSDTHGRLFLVSPPAVGNCTLQFFVCTWSSTEVKVVFTTSTTQKLIIVRKSTPNATIWTEENRSIPTASLRPVYKFQGDQYFSISVMVTFQKYNMTYKQEMLVIPVIGWGRKYFVTTLWGEPFVVIMSAIENTVKIYIRTSGLTKLQVEYKGVKHTDGDIMTVSLQVNQGFAFQFCSEGEDCRNLLGTTLDGTNPFGLISGNCAGSPMEQACNYSTSNKLVATSNSSKDAGLILEMLLPYESFGTEFVTLPLIPLKQPAYIWVMNGEVTTDFDAYDCDSKKKSYNMPVGRSRIQLDVQNCSHFIKSNKPVQVIYVFGSTCNLTDNNKPDITILVPIALFMNYYIWITPTIDSVDIQHYIMFILWKYRYMMELDGDAFSAAQAHFVEAVGAAYVVAYIEISSGTHKMANLLPSAFGLYVAGFSELFAYVRPAGFISSNIALKCTKSNSTIVAGDFIDNDCDGKVDEESKDGDDNDLDDLVDEDLFLPLPIDGSWSDWAAWFCDRCEAVWKYRSRTCTNPVPQHGGLTCIGDELQRVQDAKTCKDIMCPKVGQVSNTTKSTTKSKDALASTSVRHQNNYQTSLMTTRTFEKITRPPKMNIDDGAWSEWSELTCSENCSEKRMVQNRQCNNPPPSPRGKKCDGFPVRYKYGGCKHVCPEDCPFGTWGLNCVGSCINCIQECDKFTGRCGNCKEGFQFPLDSCNKACGHNSYGADCQGNCLEKCDGQDCLERTIGVCPANTNPFMWLWVLVPIVLIPVVIMFILKFKKSKPVDDAVIIDKMAQIMSKSEVMLYALAEIEQDRRSLYSRRSSKKSHKNKKSTDSHNKHVELKGSEVD